MVTPEQSTQYTLKAKAHAQATAYSQTIEIVVSTEGDDVTATLSTNPSVSPIVSSIVVEASGNRYFGGLQGALIKVDANDNMLWQQENVGMLYSPPVIAANNNLYFTATANNGKGQFCKIENTGTNLHCISLPNPIIGAPILNNQRALIVDLYGQVYSVQLSTNTETLLANKLPDKQIRSNAVLTSQNILVVRTTKNDIYMLDLNSAAGTGWTQSLAGEQP